MRAASLDGPPLTPDCRQLAKVSSVRPACQDLGFPTTAERRHSPKIRRATTRPCAVAVSCGGSWPAGAVGVSSGGQRLFGPGGPRDLGCRATCGVVVGGCVRVRRLMWRWLVGMPQAIRGGGWWVCPGAAAHVAQAGRGMPQATRDGRPGCRRRLTQRDHRTVGSGGSAPRWNARQARSALSADMDSLRRAPGRDRTDDLPFTRRVLWPAELQGRRGQHNVPSVSGRLGRWRKKIYVYTAVPPLGSSGTFLPVERKSIHHGYGHL
jgi:hypothetical protein